MSEVKDREVELLKLKLEYEAAQQQRRIQFWTSVFTAIMGIITPVVLVRYHVSSDQKIQTLQEDAKTLKKDAKDAAKTAEVAVLRTEEVKQDLAVVSEERKQQFNQISQQQGKLAEQQEADLKAWKAYHTKDSDDMYEARQAIAKAEAPMKTEAKPQ